LSDIVAACALGTRSGSVSNPATRRSTDPPPHRLLSTLCNRDLPRRRDAPRDPGTLSTLLATPPPTTDPTVRRILLSTYRATQRLFYSVHGTGSRQKPTHRYIEDFTAAADRAEIASRRGPLSGMPSHILQLLFFGL